MLMPTSIMELKIQSYVELSNEPLCTLFLTLFHVNDLQKFRYLLKLP